MPKPKHDPLNLAGAMGQAGLAALPVVATGLLLAWLTTLIN